MTNFKPQNSWNSVLVTVAATSIPADCSCARPSNSPNKCRKSSEDLKFQRDYKILPELVRLI